MIVLPITVNYNFLQFNVPLCFSMEQYVANTLLHYAHLFVYWDHWMCTLKIGVKKTLHSKDDLKNIARKINPENIVFNKIVGIKWNGKIASIVHVSRKHCIVAGIFQFTFATACSYLCLYLISMPSMILMNRVQSECMHVVAGVYDGG